MRSSPFALRPSLIAKRFNRIRQRGFDRLGAHREQRNQQSQSARERKYPPADVDAIGKILQPFIHGKIRHRPGDKVGDENELDEILGEQSDDAGNLGAEHFADADFLRAPFRAKRGQTEQAETGKHDRRCWP